jgi:hypothetical protein
MTRSNHRLICALGVIALSARVPAHHSGAMFDSTKSSTLRGTVKAFQWTNPHCWIQLLVASNHDPDEWSIEMGSPSQLFKGGWRPATLKVGDKVTIVVHPTRDGSRAGLFVSAVGADGSAIGTPK